MLFLVQNGYGVIAHDQSGHGRSGQSSAGNDMDTSPQALRCQRIFVLCDYPDQFYIIVSVAGKPCNV